MNHETRVVATWLDNNEYMYRKATNWATHGEAGELREWLEREYEIGQHASMVNDILQHWFDAVDWAELEERYRDDEDDEGEGGDELAELRGERVEDWYS